MAKNKTAETTENVADFIGKIADPVKRDDCYKLADLIKSQTGIDAKMWGTSIVGFGKYHYKYESGHEGDAPLIAFSPRSSAITLYMASHYETKEELLSQLGKYKTGVGCVYIKKMGDINPDILKRMITDSVAHLKKKY